MYDYTSQQDQTDYQFERFARFYYDEKWTAEDTDNES